MTSFNQAGDVPARELDGHPFTAVRRVRSFDEVVRQIQEVLLSDRYSPGDRLPNERDLCQALGVSRSTLREALRTLEGLGLLEIRPRGRAGGIFVTSPSGSSVGSALEALIRFRGPTRAELREFRISFEGETAWWAAQRAEPEDHRRLTDLAAKVRAAVDGHSGAWKQIAGFDLQFHEAVAHASKNQVRVAVMLAIMGPVRQSVLAMGLFADERMRHAVTEELTGIAEAIVAGDGERARVLARAHVKNNPALQESDGEAHPSKI